MKAIVFVDVQNDFVKGGKLEFNYPEVDNLPQLVEFARQCASANDCKLYATRDTHKKTVFEDAGTFVKFDEYGRVNDVENINGQPVSGYLATLEGKKLPVEHCIRETSGWMVESSLLDVLLGNATFIDKPTFGSYDLVEVIEEDFGKGGPGEIIICGYDLSICVLANAVMLRAKYPDAKIIVKANLCGDVDKESFDAAVKTLKMQQIDIED